MKSKSERLKEVYEHLRNHFGIHTQGGFADAIGYSRPVISSALNGNDDNVTDKMMRNISNKYPGVFNIDYLLTGEGQLLNTDEHAENVVSDDRSEAAKPKKSMMLVEIPDELQTLLDRALTITRRNEEIIERLAGAASQNHQTEIAIEKVANNLNESQQQVLQIRSDILAVTESINKFKATFDTIREENQKLRASNDILVQRLDKAVTLFDDINTKVAHILANQRYPEPPATINIASEP